MDKDFLESFAILRRCKRPQKDWTIASLPSPAIQRFCDRCGDTRTWNESRESRQRVGSRLDHKSRAPRDAEQPAIGAVIALEYFCSDCKVESVRFIVEVAEKYVSKIGQLPPPSVNISSTLRGALGDYAEPYKNGLICENQGYGIGAFAYYRRIVEGIIDELLKSIKEVAPTTSEYHAALTKAQAGFQAKDKIDLVKDYLPESLRPDGHNPLKTLHKDLSVGIHNLDDAECLELASEIRSCLEFLTWQIAAIAQSQGYFKSSMEKLLAKSREKLNSPNGDTNA